MEKNQSDPHAKAHAKLSASQTKRWMTCPGSMRLIDDMPANMRPPQSQFAALGTAAHTLGEACLKAKATDSRIYHNWWIHSGGEMQKRTPDPSEVEAGHWFQVDHDMMDAVDIYLSTVYGEMERLGPEAELSIEKRFDLSWVRPDMFGTNDASISLFLDELVVIDYKHGQGIPVDVSYRDKATGKIVGNSQLMYYLLGAAKGFDFTHQNYTLIVVQPRCPHPHGGVRRFTCTLEELIEFHDRLAEAADVVNRAYSEWDDCQTDAERVMWEQQYLCAGDHCKTAFCAKIATCPATHRRAEEEAMADFSEDPIDDTLLPVPEGVEALARALKWVPLLDARNRAIEALAMRLAEQGVKVPGQKLVRKKANRKWTLAEEEVAAALAKEGLSPKDFLTEPSLRSPAQVEKLGPAARKLVNGHKLKEDENWIIEPLAIKGVGGLTLASEDDPRTEVVIDTAADFPEEEVSVNVGEGDV